MIPKRVCLAALAMVLMPWPGDAATPGRAGSAAPGIRSAPAWSGAGRPALAVPGAPTRLAQSDRSSEALMRQLEELKRRIKAQKERDITLPVLRIDAPEQVDAGEKSYRITGFVGDDRSTPTLTVDGSPVELTAPGEGAPDLGPHTLAFDLEIAIAGDGEQSLVFEAVDAAGNPIAEMVVVQIVTTSRIRFEGEYHALIIGNRDYDVLATVETAINDAEAVAEVIERRYVFDRNNITVLTNGTRRDILGQLVGLRKSLGEDDRLLIYYSGHGYVDEATHAGFWQPADADEFDDFTWIATDDVVRNLKGMAERSAKHVLVIADSVFPIATRRGVSRRQRDEYFETIDSYVSRKMIASGVSTPTSNEGSGGHSVFAWELLTILEENQDTYITSQQLFDRLSRALVGKADRAPEWGTVPDAGDEGSGEFTFILRSRPGAAAE